MFNHFLDKAFAEAEKNGDLDDLPGAGKPLKLDTDSGNVFSKAYSESEGMTPLGIFREKISAAQERLAAAKSDEEKREIQKEIALLDTQRAIEMETWKRYS